ncbi:MAG TPA: protein phosphatase 2C domain-containing protein [Candidatus Coprenecus pullistercoris]|nr:protein phosphatase 2C domain-containing protein [Candidatus Coprenecus pullistercoris]
MGGAQGGKHASELAVSTIVSDVSEASSADNPLSVIRKAVSHANTVIYEEGQKDEYKGMGTTLTVLLLTDKEAITAHVGDSRIYQLRHGRKIFRTDDHSMVFDMVRAKVITEEQARLSDCSNIILKALGVSESVEADMSVLPYCKGDRFVLCSDGFWSAFDETVLIKKLSVKGSPEDLLESVADEIDQIGKGYGGNHDNLTAAMVIVDKGSAGASVRMPLSNRYIMLSGLLLIISACLNFYFLRVASGLRHDASEWEKRYEEVHDNLYRLLYEDTVGTDKDLITGMETIFLQMEGGENE